MNLCSDLKVKVSIALALRRVNEGDEKIRVEKRMNERTIKSLNPCVTD